MLFLDCLTSNQVLVTKYEKYFETTPIGHYSSSPGSIYPALRRLMQEGLIQQIEASSLSSSSKKKFSLTQAGIESFIAWLNKPVSREDVINHLADLVLRFAFMGDLVDTARKVAFLTAFIEETDSYIAELKQFRKSANTSMPLHGLLALDHGIESAKADSRWARGALKVISK